MNRILIIQTASIGDVILATAVAESLHNAFPGAAITLLVKKGNESLFQDHPYVDKVIPWDKKSGKLQNFFRILGTIRHSKFDLVINIQRFFLTGALTAFSGSRESRGFAKNPLALLFSKRFEHPIGSGTHEINRNHALISDLAGPEPAKPRLYPPAADQAAVEKLILPAYYTISPASLWFTKQYPPDKWAGLIRQIPADSVIYLLGAPVDRELCQEIISLAAHPGVRDLSGQLTLLQSAALMEKAAMNFTNDSAPMHLASALNAPVTAIYCSTVPEFGFGPLSDDSAIVQTGTPLSCRPCGLHGYRECPEKHFRCGREIDPLRLTARLRE
jgi:heptosyltransferase-2